MIKIGVPNEGYLVNITFFLFYFQSLKLSNTLRDTIVKIQIVRGFIYRGDPIKHRDHNEFFMKKKDRYLRYLK